VNGVAGKTAARERNEPRGEQRGGQDVNKRKESTMQQAARQIRGGQENGRSDAASGTAGKEHLSD
jgi:hypothetical protein